MSSWLPPINPAITGLGSRISSTLSAATTAATTSAPGARYAWTAVILGAVLFIVLLSWYFSKMHPFLETPANISRINRENMEAQADYEKKNPSRTSMLTSIKAAPEADRILGNMYISTVNAAGLFYPANGGIASGDAGRLAILGGARAFVFDIWPDLRATGRYRPIIQFVDEGSKWRRSSINSLPFVTVLREIVKEAFEIDNRPGRNDPVFFYLRFRGTPRTETFIGVFNALRGVCERYRLPQSYNACNNQANISNLSASDLSGKMVVFSSIRRTGTALDDYINAAPSNGIDIEKPWLDVKSTKEDATALNKMRIEAQTNMLWVAPLSESADAANNAIDIDIAHAAGIHFVAMNFWNRTPTLAKYMDAARFGTASFVMKPK
jgi:hypothetical protein